MAKTNERKTASEIGRAEAAQRRRNAVMENLSFEERSTITNALSVAALRFDADAKVFRDIATALRKGERMAMFAEGEVGAMGAERLMKQFEKQAAESRELADWIS